MISSNSSLNWVEQLYLQIIDTDLPPGVIVLLAIYITYIPTTIFLTLAHAYNLFIYFRIERNKTIPSSEYWRATKWTFFNFIFLLTPSTLSLPRWLIPDLRSPIPSISSMLLTLVGFILINDITHYWLHRWNHSNKIMYQKIHKIHHSFHTPFAMSTLAMHPIEFLENSMLESIPILIFRPHFFFMLLFTIHRSCGGLFAHQGFDFPSIGHYIPIFTDTKFHDLHHTVNTGNYAEELTIWDKIFKSTIDPKVKMNMKEE